MSAGEDLFRERVEVDLAIGSDREAPGAGAKERARGLEHAGVVGGPGGYHRAGKAARETGKECVICLGGAGCEQNALGCFAVDQLGDP